MTHELVLPEYGRNIQNMVELCKQIKDRNERNRCARSIIACMGNLFPYLRDNEAFRHKLWDHLALMANFELDIDYPFEITIKKTKDIKPEPIPMPHKCQGKRHYGKFIYEFIDQIVKNPNIKGRKELIVMTANYMKRCYNMYNQDMANDNVIFNDLYQISNGKIDLRQSGIRLVDMQYERRKSSDKNKKNRH